MSFDILMITFRLMLFGLLVYKLRQLIISYAVPFLNETMNQEKKQREELLDQKRMLKTTHTQLEKQILQQQETFSALDKKILSWNRLILKQKEEEDNIAKQIQLDIEKKRKLQYNYLFNAKNSLLVIPAACGQAAENIQQKLDGKNGQLLLHSLINKLP